MLAESWGIQEGVGGGLASAYADTRPVLVVVVAEEKEAAQLNVMPSRGQTAWS